MQLKHLPSYTHHVCADAINTAVVDEDKWCVTGRKEWRVLFEYDIFAHLILGVGKWTVSPSSTSRNWQQGMRESFHLKSLSRTTSVVSIPNQEKFPQVGLTKHSKIFLRG